MRGVALLHKLTALFGMIGSEWCYLSLPYSLI